MVKIICRYDVCVFNKKNLCTAEAIEYDPDEGCLTARDRDEFEGVLEEDWEDEVAAEVGADEGETEAADADELDEEEDDWEDDEDEDDLVVEDDEELDDDEEDDAGVLRRRRREV